MTVEALVFDLDDTLYCERDFAFSGFKAVEDGLTARYGLSGFAKVAWRLFRAGERSRVLGRALETYGITDPRLEASLVELYRSHQPKIALSADAAAFLERDTRPRAIITDGFAETQRRKIEALRLGGHGFDPIVCTSELGIGFGKPHPRAFELVEAHLGLKGHRLAYVADNPAKDFIAPRHLGWRTVQITRPGAVHPPSPAGGVAAEVRIERLDELYGALGQRESLSALGN